MPGQAVADRLPAGYAGSGEPPGVSLLDKACARILTPAAKFWVCKRGIELVGEGMEVLGGNGYTEDGPLARLYREAPVNSIWEGSGNVMCLDVLRAMESEPALADALLSWLSQQCRDDAVLRARLDDLCALRAGDAASQQRAARRIAQDLVLLTQAVLVRTHAPQVVADAFIHSRFSETGRVFGAAQAPDQAEAILSRAFNAL